MQALAVLLGVLAAVAILLRALRVLITSRWLVARPTKRAASTTSGVAAAFIW